MALGARDRAGQPALAPAQARMVASPFMLSYMNAAGTAFTADAFTPGVTGTSARITAGVRVGYTVPSADPVGAIRFDVEYTLDGDALLVRVPGDGIVEEGDLMIVSLQVLPFLGAHADRTGAAWCCRTAAAPWSPGGRRRASPRSPSSCRCTARNGSPSPPARPRGRGARPVRCPARDRGPARVRHGAPGPRAARRGRGRRREHPGARRPRRVPRRPQPYRRGVHLPPALHRVPQPHRDRPALPARHRGGRPRGAVPVPRRGRLAGHGGRRPEGRGYICDGRGVVNRASVARGAGVLRHREAAPVRRPARGGYHVRAGRGHRARGARGRCRALHPRSRRLGVRRVRGTPAPHAASRCGLRRRARPARAGRRVPVARRSSLPRGGLDHRGQGRVGIPCGA